jgi:hypothetical protein
MNDFQLLKARHFARKVAEWVAGIDATHAREDLPTDFAYLAYYSDELNEILDKADLSQVEADIEFILKHPLNTER